MSRRVLAIFLATALPAFGGAPTGKLKWQSLFDGATLNGWEPDGRGKWTVEDGPDPALMDRLAAKYTDLERHPLALRDSPTAVVVRVSIDRISGVGPWVDTATTR